MPDCHGRDLVKPLRKERSAVVVEEVVLTVRVPPATLKRIDSLVKARRSKIPRHSWLLEAIYEKLDREDQEL